MRTVVDLLFGIISYAEMVNLPARHALKTHHGAIANSRIQSASVSWLRTIVDLVPLPIKPLDRDPFKNNVFVGLAGT